MFPRTRRFPEVATGAAAAGAGGVAFGFGFPEARLMPPAVLLAEEALACFAPVLLLDFVFDAVRAADDAVPRAEREEPAAVATLCAGVDCAAPACFGTI